MGFYFVRSNHSTFIRWYLYLSSYVCVCVRVSILMWFDFAISISMFDDGFSEINELFDMPLFAYIFNHEVCRFEILCVYARIFDIIAEHTYTYICASYKWLEAQGGVRLFVRSFVRSFEFSIHNDHNA